MEKPIWQQLGGGSQAERNLLRKTNQNTTQLPVFKDITHLDNRMKQCKIFKELEGAARDYALKICWLC